MADVNSHDPKCGWRESDTPIMKEVIKKITCHPHPTAAQTIA
jgi:hypothetical protein